MRLLHYSAKPFTFDPNLTYQDERPRDHKPVGFWLSVPGEADWKDWCEGESFNLEGLKHVYEVTLKPDANVLVVDTLEKLDAFHTLYALKDPFEYRAVDWSVLKRIHDGIIIAPYQYERRLTLGWYYTWDCASGVIWNLNAIADVRPVTTCESETR
jgi:hypothetical protein